MKEEIMDESGAEKRALKLALLITTQEKLAKVVAEGRQHCDSVIDLLDGLAKDSLKSVEDFKAFKQGIEKMQACLPRVVTVKKSTSLKKAKGNGKTKPVDAKPVVKKTAPPAINVPGVGRVQATAAQAVGIPTARAQQAGAA
jgi:hypothetical protein